MWARLSSWFLQTAIGRWLLTAAAFAVAVGIAFLRGRSAGKASEQNKVARQSLENLQERAKSDDEINKMSPDARNDEFSKWVRDE